MRIVFYCPAVIGFAASLVEEMKEIKEIQVSDVALGRPSASKLLGQELQKVESYIFARDVLYLGWRCPISWSKMSYAQSGIGVTALRLREWVARYLPTS